MSYQLNQIKKYFLLIVSLFCGFNFSAYAGINPRTGVFTVDAVNTMGLLRHYRSDDKEAGLFGTGWKSVFDTRLHEEPERLFVFGALDNVFYEFERDGNDDWVGDKGEIEKTETGFVWLYDDDRYVFNSQGLMIRYYDDGKSYQLEYGIKGRLKRLVTYEGKDYAVTVDVDGRVLQFLLADEDDGDSVTYVYENGVMRSVSDADGLVEYQYTKDGNISYVGFPDAEAMIISYQAYDNKMRAMSFLQGDEKETYKYELVSDIDSIKYFIVESEKEKDGVVNNYRYEYEDLYAGDDYSYTINQKIFKNDSLIFEESHLNPCLISKLTRRGVTSRYRYDDSAHLVAKEEGQNLHEYSYNDAGNMTYYRYSFNNDPLSVRWTRFSYNEKHKITQAVNSSGLHLLLEYDSEGQIMTMRTEDTEIIVAYHSMNKPERIEVVGLGAITISYDMYGEIESTDSGDNGIKISLAITRAFQDMLSVLKPADLNKL